MNGGVQQQQEEEQWQQQQEKRRAIDYINSVFKEFNSIHSVNIIIIIRIMIIINSVHLNMKQFFAIFSFVFHKNAFIFCEYSISIKTEY